MPDAYEIHDAQFLQIETVTSAANDLTVVACAAPAVGRVRTVFAACVRCSVAEAQTYWFAIYSPAAGIYFPVVQPASRTITPAVQQYFGALTEGMELKLFPGEILVAMRAAATAGSTITAFSRFVENDIQFYVELDKHKVLRRRSSAMMESSPSVSRSGAGGGGGGVRGGGGWSPPAR